MLCRIASACFDPTCLLSAAAPHQPSRLQAKPALAGSTRITLYRTLMTLNRTTWEAPILFESNAIAPTALWRVAV